MVKQYTQRFRRLSAALGLALLVSLSGGFAASAQDGVSGSGSSGSGSGSGSTSGSGETEASQPTTSTTTSESQTTTTETHTSDSSSKVKHDAKKKTKHKTETEHANEIETADSSNDDPVKLHKAGDLLLAKIRHEHKNEAPKTAQGRQKSCEAHKAELTRRLTGIVDRATTGKSKIDSIFEKAQTYGKTLSTTPADYAGLVAAAHTAEGNAAIAVSNLQAVTPSTIVCTDTTAASEVATFRVATSASRDTLKSYRNAVKAVLHSLETTKPTKTTQTEGSQQ